MKILFGLLLLLSSGLVFSQKGSITGKIIDNSTDLPIAGAKVNIDNKYRAFSNPDGIYELLNVPFGDYVMVISMTTFDTVRVKIKVNSSSVEKDVKMGGSVEFAEIEVIGNMVKDNVPIAVTKIPTQKIVEELGSRDLPMLLNGTAGVYATTQGGGDGDARINVRGFDQRNVGVMIDGVPVNDMENGAVYWSNWFGLDAITAQMQVQRGLGATKIAMPSIGGTINILTQGIGNKKGGMIKQEYSTGNMLRTTFSYNTGMTKSGW